MPAPNWTQKSGYKLATLQERVTTTIDLPLDPSTQAGGGFNPSTGALSLDPVPKVTNTTDLTITINTPNDPVTDHVYDNISIRIPSIPALNNKLVPVCILLHDNGGSGSNMIADWQNYLGDHILIAPTGINQDWNIAVESKHPDIQFLEELIVNLKNYSNVDSTKIRILGVGNGGALAQRALIEIDDSSVDTFVFVKTALFDPQFRTNTFYKPSSYLSTGLNDANYDTVTSPILGRRILTINGINDTTIDYNGGISSDGYNYYPAQDNTFYWAKSQGYNGNVIPDVGGIFYGAFQTYYYSYLSGQVLHYKTGTTHTIEDFEKTIVSNFLLYTQDNLQDVYLDVGSATSITLNTDVITLISGKLPDGMRLSSSQIIGTPFEVARNTEFEFVLRATNEDGIRDRTFIIEVQGPDEPVWSTNEGLLPIGTNNSFYVLDSSIIDFQLAAIDPDLPAGDTLEYYVADGDGELPPGTQLTVDGRLVGIIDPILALDKNAGQGFYDTTQFDAYAFDFGLRSANGFESYYYDTQGYDYAIATQSRKKLNRYYEFKVSVSDGDTIEKRTFQIYVVGDDFLRSDNTVMQVGTGIFTADNTYLRAPVWLTPADLGYKRANNYITIYLEVFDPQTILGELQYNLEALNDDGSPSILPPGMSIDAISGEVAGRIPYQPAITKEYKFTVNAIRYTDIGSDILAEKKKTFTVKILGEVESTIQWTTVEDLGTIQANFTSTFSVNAVTNVPNATLLYNLTEGRLPPGLSINLNGEIVGKVRQFANDGNLGLTTIDKNLFTLDGGTSTIDRKFTFTIEARDRFGFSATKKTFNIVVTDPDNITYSNLYVKPFLKETQRQIYKNFIGDSNIFLPGSIYRPNDSQFGLQKDIKMLVYAGIETRNIREYISASRKNHKRKRFKFGALRTAVAKNIGSTDTLYEVIYVDVIDPLKNIENENKLRSKISIANKDKITVDSIELETRDDVTKEGAGLAVFEIRNSIGQLIQVRALGNDLEIITRAGTVVYDANGSIQVTLRNGQELNVGQIATTSSDPFRFRPDYNTLKVDSDAVIISDPNDNTRFLSSVDNMRENISQVGITEASFLPLWMATAQGDGVQELGYVTAVPLCYCKPGTSQQILLNIQNSGFDFKQIDFEIDRYIIDATENNSNEQYIAFGNYRYNV